ncbi:hypothetical protein KKF38_02165 [Patescibacteria group bacterium]|nr:hypothetical protein [Patescibacteria group bacterium]
MAETLKTSNPILLPRSKLAQELAARTEYQEKSFSEKEIREAADKGIYIFRSVDELAKMTEKDVSEWPSLLRKNDTKFKMNLPPGLDQKKFEAVVKKFDQMKIDYLLKNEVAITPEQSAEAHEKVAENNKVKLFLDENPGFEMDVKNKIHDLRNAPTNDPEKTIYENTLFFLEMSFRKLLILNLKAAAKAVPADKQKGIDLQKVAEESTKEWIGALEKMADGPTLEYHELLVPKAGVYAPEVEKLLMNPQFLREAGTLAEKKDKKEFISAYLQKWAMVAGEANAESATRFLNEAHSTMMQSVGEKHISQEEFQKIWEEEISQNPAAVELLKTAKNGESKALENFNEWLNEKDEAQIIAESEKEEYRRKNREFESNSNPHGFFSRKWGSLSSAFLYYGKDILIGIVVVNLALAKFNPIKLLSNPVAWVTAGGVGLITNHFSPLFPKTPDVKKAAEDDLKNKIKTLQERHPTVQEWLVKFGKSDIAANGKIGRLLAEKGRDSITSAEIKKFLGEDEVPPESEILGKSTEARLLFKFFQACQNENIDPKNLENV